MRLVLSMWIALLVGCGDGSAPADYLATGGQDGGATGGQGDAAPAGTGGSSASCNIPLAMVNGSVTSATSSGTSVGSGPLPQVTACASAGSGVAQSTVKVISGQPNGETDWKEVSLTLSPVDGGCAASIDYSRVGISYDGGITCDETLSVTLTVPPQ